MAAVVTVRGALPSGRRGRRCLRGGACEARSGASAAWAAAILTRIEIRAEDSDRVALLELARAWIAQDPDPATRRELESEIERGALDRIGSRFGEPLRFGTAGIRGRLGAGPSRMNVATVRRVTAALAGELLAQALPCTPPPSVVVGRDARRCSESFAVEAARVLSGAGVRVLMLPEALPTPVLAFAVRELCCAAGVMVTASHNPRDENGLKIYTQEGVQIVAPLDEAISQRMRAIADPREIPLGDTGELLDGQVLEAYLDALAAIDCCRPAPARVAAEAPGAANPPRRATGGPRILYTPLHGAGARTLLAAFARTGGASPELYAPQAEPDPDFPTVGRPNPQEHEALAPLLRAAAAGGYELALANDPDADRLAAAVPAQAADDPDAQAGWRVLSGDEIGALLADHVLRRAGSRARGLLVATVPSSTLLAELAHQAGVPFAQTLSGFKWVMRAPAALGRRTRLLFGYEEALGYAVSDVVRDKDGVSAALALSACAEDAAREGMSLLDRLECLARRHGLHATRQLSIVLEGAHAAARAREVMAALRERPPRELAGEAVDWFEDLLHGDAGRAGARCPGPGTRADRARVPGLPPADVLVFGCGAQTRVVVRASGTEAKLKVYLQRVEPVNGALARPQLRAGERLSELTHEMHALIAGTAKPRHQ